MTEEQVDRIVANLCRHLRHAIRVMGTEAFPSNLRELGFDAASVKTALKTGLHAAGITVYSTAALAIKKRNTARPVTARLGQRNELSRCRLLTCVLQVRALPV